MRRQSLLSFVPGGRDNAVFIQKRAFETLASQAQDGSYYLHPAAIDCGLLQGRPVKRPGNDGGAREPNGDGGKAENDQVQGEALFARMREAATWEAPSVVQETLVGTRFRTLLPYFQPYD